MYSEFQFTHENASERTILHLVKKPSSFGCLHCKKATPLAISWREQVNFVPLDQNRTFPCLGCWIIYEKPDSGS